MAAFANRDLFKVILLTKCDLSYKTYVSLTDLKQQHVIKHYKINIMHTDKLKKTFVDCDIMTVISCQ